MVNLPLEDSSGYFRLQRALAWSAPFALAIGIVDLAMGEYLLGAADLFVCVALYVCWWLVKRRYNLLRLQHASVLTAALIFLAALLDGGLADAGFVWSFGFPMIACFIAGSRAGLYWAIAYAAVAAAALSAARQVEGLMHYRLDALAYALVAYGMFAGFAYFMAMLRERREETLSQMRQDLEQKINQLRESEANYRAVLNTTPNAIGVHRDGRWIYVNPAGVRLFGAASEREIIGDQVIDYVHPDCRAMVAERIKQLQAGRSVPPVEEKLLRKDGRVIEAEVQVSPIVFEGRPAILTICRDITERKAQEREVARLQAEYAHAQRLESLGVMAGGIAHDFNNLLAAIMGNIELASLEVDKDSPAAAYLANADEACERASGLARQMLAYAGKGGFSVKAIHLASYLRGMRDMLKASLGKGIDLHLHVAEDLPEVMVDEAQFQQVILNLIVNASEAIDGVSGEIVLEAEPVEMNRLELTEFMNGENIAAGRYVAIRVRDNGQGIEEEILPKIFDPFFTTKKTGSGLGLSAILGIIRRHKGGIKVISKPGQGTEFTILLPLAETLASSKKVRTDDAVRLKGQGVALVVDDEARVRELVGSMLERIGFEVVHAENGMLALEMFRKYQKNLAVVLMDITMPRMGGVAAMRLMREIDPNIPILLASGYSEHEIDALPPEERPDGFVHKPFRYIELKKALLGVLRADGEGA